MTEKRERSYTAAASAVLAAIITLFLIAGGLSI